MPKTASLVHFYFGEDSYLKRLAQETVPLGMALEGYDRSVLLHHKTEAGPFEVSAADEKNATVVDTPTEANLIEQLNDLGAAGYEVDLYVFTHGGPGKFLVSRGTYGDSAWASGPYMQSHVTPLNLRAVWQCNCWGQSLNAMWRRLGAKVSMGTRGVDFYPTRFSGFAKAWADGKSFGTSVTESNTALVRSPAQAFMLVDAASRLGEWGGNILQAATVLGHNDAAEKYFRACWVGNDYQTDKSGKVNMNYASTMIIDGDRSVTR
jgi:hypothetical protein